MVNCLGANLNPLKKLISDSQIEEFIRRGMHFWKPGMDALPTIQLFPTNSSWCVVSIKSLYIPHGLVLNIHLTKALPIEIPHVAHLKSVAAFFGG